MSTDKTVMLITNHDDDVYCFRKELIESIIDNGYRMIISCPYGEKMELMKDIDFEFDDVRIDRRGMNPFSDIKLYRHYYNVLKKKQPDVVLTYTSKPNVYASIAAAQLNIPYINNVTGLGSVLGKGTVVRKGIMLLFKLAFCRAACIFFQNEENMKLAKKQGMIKGDYRLIPGSGVNTDRFPLQPYPDDEKIVFNYIGRVLHDKGVDDYIEAAKIIRKKYEKAEFNIIGFIEPTEKHYEKELEELQKQEVIIYHGSRKDIRPFIKRAHATIHPSTYGEGMSNVLLESASSGRPLITTDNPGCRETVVDGKTGFIYPGGNVEALVDRIEKFMAMKNSERCEMGAAGREFVIENFSRKLVVEAYLKKINEIV